MAEDEAAPPTVPTVAERAMAALDQALAAEPELTEGALRLLTINGLMNALADLLERFSSGGDRDDIAAMNGEHKTLKLAGELLNNFLSHRLSVDHIRRLSAVEAEVRGRDGSGSTSFGDFDPPEASDTGAN